jgi:hypothetical protein
MDLHLILYVRFSKLEHCTQSERFVGRGVVKLNCLDCRPAWQERSYKLQPFFLDRTGVGSSSAGKAGNGLVKYGALNLRTTPLCMPSSFQCS